MMRYSIFLAFFLLPLLSSGCQTTALPLQEQGELSGRIYVVGNDPFTKVALALDERNSVVLLCTSEVEKFLRGHQGEQAKVTYTGLSQVPEGQAVRVTSAQLVKE